MREIVDKCAGGDALVPCHSTILVGDRAIPEMNVGRGAIEANGAKTTALQLQSAIPFPRRGSSARSADPQMDIRSMRPIRSEEHTSELQSRRELVCRLLLEKKKFGKCGPLIDHIARRFE